MTLSHTDSPDSTALEKEVDTEGVSQGRLIFRRFVRNKIAMISLVVFLAVVALSVTSIGAFGIPGWWHYKHTDLPVLMDGGKPTLSLIPEWLGGAGIQLGEHPFGQTLIGIDYFAMT
ncbi:MAG TPA: ABC transporter permease, partial [Terrimesophilobacter sp.]|nr:ABC transporter permease [Terrimesophilobacter sp.]